MDKRYQVFISSTFTDLIEERQAVLKAVLELDHMPAGMELFPAIDDTAWQLITDVIDASDYYVLIIGGRYGSLDETGISYTEKEYDYAVSANKPVIPLLHKNPDNLPRGKTETDETAWKKLQEFRLKIENNHTCVYWNSPDDLKAKVIVGLTSTVKRYPAIGWIRSDEVPTEATLADVLAMKTRISELEAALNRARTSPPPGTDDLMQGSDSFELRVNISSKPIKADIFAPYNRYQSTISPTWNDIFAAVAPVMINELRETELRKAFRRYFEMISRDEFETDDIFHNQTIESLYFENSDIDTCLVQLRALGLICISERKRSVTDTTTYWTLTPYGDQLMVQLRALRKTPIEYRKIGGRVEKVDDEENDKEKAT